MVVYNMRPVHMLADSLLGPSRPQMLVSEGGCLLLGIPSLNILPRAYENISGHVARVSSRHVFGP